MSNKCKGCGNLLETCRLFGKSQIEGKIKGHSVRAERENPESDWYITVQAPNGAFSYDGCWRDSAHKSSQEAIEEAIKGANL